MKLPFPNRYHSAVVYLADIPNSMGSHTSPHHNASSSMFYGWNYMMRL
ncbi:hypothetical protein RO3G_05615 [Rhizopus delemar RA 99-880]|uniref:Uncharacterized protein n=1 Tax=Rhizopus delemar (strain RA 99-880 / ATCC MYA-4621 / FGSC 9543 / NRRL 43880) TaxID=246409 RepID=I1BXI0_RHIO9|nr:hypothetical protein RO3G_05615 [Rhizopus delemar RA 99-880]|eukprot:EIE80910.1 hypothetical protein RO3G_05615 [Rhizopus delemar RA 99-880]